MRENILNKIGERMDTYEAESLGDDRGKWSRQTCSYNGPLWWKRHWMMVMTTEY
jgi:hypothetical protein